MAENNFITHPVKVKVIQDVDNISLADAEVGELFFDSSSDMTLNIKVDDTWLATTTFT